LASRKEDGSAFLPGRGRSRKGSPAAVRELHVPQPELVKSPGHRSFFMHGLVACPEEFPHVDVLRADLAAEPALAAGRDEPGRHRSVAVEGARGDGDLDLLGNASGKLFKIAHQAAVADACVAAAPDAPRGFSGSLLFGVLFT